MWRSDWRSNPRSKNTCKLILAMLASLQLTLSACNIYSSSDRKSFNSNGATNTHLANVKRPLSARTECQPIDNTSALLLRGVDIVHASEAWNVESGDADGTYRFVWARRSERSSGVICVTQPLSEYEFEHSLEHLPSLASHLSARFP